MSFETLRDRLDGVRDTGPGRFMARCPAHEDRSPSLGVRDCGDGRTILNCLAGCEAENVLAAVGLTFSDLYPERSGLKHAYKPIRNRISPRDALAALDHESLVVTIIGADFLEHKKIDDETWDRLGAAVNRINTLRAECSPARIGK